MCCVIMYIALYRFIIYEGRKKVCNVIYLLKICESISFFEYDPTLPHTEKVEDILRSIAGLCCWISLYSAECNDLEIILSVSNNFSV